MSESTKERILDAAERLFADQGIDSTSLRAVTTAAEVNLAAVNYHFGSKHELYAAVLEHAFATGVPHSPQNFAPSRTSSPHPAQIIGQGLGCRRHAVLQIVAQITQNLDHLPAP